MYITTFDQDAPGFGCFFGENKHGPFSKHVMFLPIVRAIISSSAPQG